MVIWSAAPALAQFDKPVEGVTALRFYREFVMVKFVLVFLFFFFLVVLTMKALQLVKTPEQYYRVFKLASFISFCILITSAILLTIVNLF
jgi:hypothetical protein